MAEAAASTAMRTARNLLMRPAYPGTLRAKPSLGNLALTSRSGAHGDDHPLPVRDDLAPQQRQGAHGRRAGRRHDSAGHRWKPAPHSPVEPAAAGTHGVRAAPA